MTKFEKNSTEQGYSCELPAFARQTVLRIWVATHTSEGLQSSLQEGVLFKSPSWNLFLSRVSASLSHCSLEDPLTPLLLLFVGYFVQEADT